jgi:hypothetical protein
MTAACKQALAKRLRSPSTLKVIEVSRSQEKMDRADYEAYLRHSGEALNVAQFLLQMYDDGHPFYRHLRRFEYDATNAFGVPLRNISECEYDSSDETPHPISEIVEIDGKTYAQFLIDSARN